MYFSACKGSDKMPRARDPNRDKAYRIYKENKGKIELTDIATQLNVPKGTVRGWKAKDKWEQKLNGTLQKDMERSKHKKTKSNKDIEAVEDEANDVIENDELTEKQRLFCVYYVKYRNKTKAYQKAFQCSYENACSHASELWKNGEIQNQINSMLSEFRESVGLDIKDLFQWQMDIARADINDFVQINGQMIMVKGNIDGLVVSEVSETANGVKVKLNDRQKAINWLSEHIGLADEKQKAEIALINAKINAGKEEKEDKLDKLFDQIEGALKDAE